MLFIGCGLFVLAKEQMRTNDKRAVKSFTEELFIRKLMQVAAALAKQLVQMRNAIERTLMAQGRIGGVQMQQKSMGANQKVADDQEQKVKFPYCSF